MKHHVTCCFGTSVRSKNNDWRRKGPIPQLSRKGGVLSDVIPFERTTLGQVWHFLQEDSGVFPEKDRDIDICSFKERQLQIENVHRKVRLGVRTKQTERDVKKVSLFNLKFYSQCLFIHGMSASTMPSWFWRISETQLLALKVTKQNSSLFQSLL